jgi:hypothetical protein
VPSADAVNVPVIASGGVGTLDHLAEGRDRGGRRRRARGEHLPLRRAHRSPTPRQALTAAGLTVRPVQVLRVRPEQTRSPRASRGGDGAQTDGSRPRKWSVIGTVSTRVVVPARSSPRAALVGRTELVVLGTTASTGRSLVPSQRSSWRAVDHLEWGSHGEPMPCQPWVVDGERDVGAERVPHRSRPAGRATGRPMCSIAASASDLLAAARSHGGPSRTLHAAKVEAQHAMPAADRSVKRAIDRPWRTCCRPWSGCGWVSTTDESDRIVAATARPEATGRRWCAGRGDWSGPWSP